MGQHVERPVGAEGVVEGHRDHRHVHRDQPAGVVRHHQRAAVGQLVHAGDLGAVPGLHHEPEQRDQPGDPLAVAVGEALADVVLGQVDPVIGSSSGLHPPILERVLVFEERELEHIPVCALPSGPRSHRLRGVDRMEGVDAGYLYMETPTMHMHTLKIAVLGAGGGVRPDQAPATRCSRGCAELPPLAATGAPGAVPPQPPALGHRPGRRPDGTTCSPTTCRLPAGWPELEALIGRVAGTPLDRTRPLWEMHVCQGLGDGRVAVIAKMHHALADGVAANALLGNIVDGLGGDPRPARTARGATDGSSRRRPGRADPAWRCVDAVRQIGRPARPGLRGRCAAVAAVVRHRRALDGARCRDRCSTCRARRSTAP